MRPVQQSWFRAFVALGIVALAGCATTEYHYSQLYGQRYYKTPLDTYPVTIVRVDGKDTTLRPVLVDPGLRRITVQGPHGGAYRLGEEREFSLDVRRARATTWSRCVTTASTPTSRSGSTTRSRWAAARRRRRKARGDAGAAPRSRAPARRVPGPPRPGGRARRRFVLDRSGRGARCRRRVGRRQVADGRFDHRPARPARADRRR